MRSIRFDGFDWGRLMGSALLLLLLLPPPHGRAQEADTLTLLRAATLAMEAHPSVGIARQELEGARATASEARAQWLPSLSAGGSLSRFQEPMVVAPFHGFDPNSAPEFDRTLVQGSLTLGYTLFDGGARSARIGRAEAASRSAGARLDGSRMDLLRRVVEGYLGVLTERDVVEAHRQRLEALNEELGRARRLFAEGAVPRLEVLRARASLGRARADARSAEIRLRVAWRELARLTGRPEERASETVLVEPSTPTPPESPELPSGPEPPELRAAREGLAAAREARGVARSAWLPDLRARAGFNEFGSGDGDFTGEWQAALQVSYPLFTGGARSAADQRADAEVRRARETLALTRLRVRSELDRAFSALQDALARTEALEATVRQFEEVARIEALALEAGSGVQRDLLTAQASLLDARAQLARARHATSLARASLARVRGELDLDWIRTHLPAPGEETAR